MVDLDALVPWLVAFFAIAAVGTAVSVVVLVRELAAVRRDRQGRQVIPMSAGHPGTAAVNRHAA
jgi:hypothetical protein